MKDIIWKKVKGYEGKYQISNTGEIKSFIKEEEGALINTRHSKTGKFTTVKLYSNTAIHEFEKFRVINLIRTHFTTDEIHDSIKSEVGYQSRTKKINYKKVIHVETGKVYNSAYECAMDLFELPVSDMVRKICTGAYTPISYKGKTYTFKYTELDVTDSNDSDSEK